MTRCVVRLTTTTPRALLKLTQMLRDTGLADVQLARQSGQIPAPGNTDKSMDAFERDVLSIPIRHYPLHNALMRYGLEWNETVSNKQVSAMNVLIVFAHPETKSLSASLHDVAVKELDVAVHTVQVSDR